MGEFVAVSIIGYPLSHLVWQPYLLTFSWHNTRRFFKLGQYYQDRALTGNIEKTPIYNTEVNHYTIGLFILVEYFTWI